LKRPSRRLQLAAQESVDLAERQGFSGSIIRAAGVIRSGASGE
jgi:hypothetical protein